MKVATVQSDIMSFFFFALMGLFLEQNFFFGDSNCARVVGNTAPCWAPATVQTHR